MVKFIFQPYYFNFEIFIDCIKLILYIFAIIKEYCDLIYPETIRVYIRIVVCQMLYPIMVLFFVFTLADTAFLQTDRYGVTDTSASNRLYEIDSSQSQNSLDTFKSPQEPNSGSTLSPLLQDKKDQLSLFGFDLFNRNKPEMSTPGAEVLVLPPNYQLGPGDRIGIYLLGTVQQNFDVVVNVEGKVFVPPAGVFYVWGLRMDEFKQLLTGELVQYYDNFDVDIMLLQPKNVMVAVVGDVKKPGKYVLSALNTVLDAVITAGGPTENGSIRDIQLIRDGQELASVDLYEFLMSGKTEYDAFLQAGDRILVPLAKSKAVVKGEVKRASIFELRSDLNEKLTDLIELAGGFTDYAFRKKIEISRLQDDGTRTLFYVNYNDVVDGDSTANIVLQNHDEIHVYSKLEQIHEREVAIYGEIRKPGIYSLEDNMHLSDLILKAGNLTRKAYILEAEVAKVDPGKPTSFIKVNLDRMQNATNGDSDVLLEADDQVFIRQIPKWEVGLMVEVEGEVMFPGKYSIVKDSTYLSEILNKAGGFTEEAFLQEAYVRRPGSRPKFDKEFERLRKMRREEMSELEYQYLVMRQNSQDVNRIVVDFKRLFYHHDRTQDVILEDGDVIVIPRAPTVVTVTGRVGKPGGVTHVTGANMQYYLAKAGGASWDADLRKTKIIKVSGEVLDDEDVKIFEAGDIIWVPRKEDKNFWPIALQAVTVMAQLASIYLIIDTSVNRN